MVLDMSISSKHIYREDVIFIHPELSDGEIFFTNSDSKNFESVTLKTKRKGNQAYDGKGNRQETHFQRDDWFPVFIKITEIEALNTSLTELRRAFRDNFRTV